MNEIGLRRVGVPRGLGVVAALGVLLAGCGARPAAEHKAPPAEVEALPGESQLTRITLTPEAVQRLGIATAELASRVVDPERWVAGEVFLPTDAVRLLTAPVAATVAPTSEVPAAGASVAKGETLATLAPVVPPEALANLRAATATAEGEIARAEVRLEIATTQRDRTQKLLDRGAISTRLRDEAAAEYDSALASLAAAKQSRDVLLAATPSSQGGSAQIEIRAPFDGIVRRADAAPGQEVPAGAALVEIVALDRMLVRVALHVGEADLVDPDAPVQVRVAGRTLTAKPALAPPAADPLAATVHLFYDVGTAAASLRPGQRVEVGLVQGRGEPRLVAPFSAVVFDAYGGAWIYAQTGPTRFERRRVDIEGVRGAGTADALAVLVHGPAVGTVVVTAGAPELFGTEFGGSK